MIRAELPLTAKVKSAIRQPKEIFHYSRTSGDNLYDYSDKELGYYYLPESDVRRRPSLRAGISDFQQYDEYANPPHLDGILFGLTQYEKRSSKHRKVSADIITYRGILRRILALPFDSRDPLMLNVCYFDGHILIESEPNVPEVVNDKQRELTYSGYKFENIATIPKPAALCTREELDSRFQKPVNTISQYCAVVKTGIGKVRCIVGGEVDCVWDYAPEKMKPQETETEVKTPVYAEGTKFDRLPHYVELKTAGEIHTTQQAVNFERKLMAAWAQCFLLGVRRVIVGFRSESVELSAVEHYEVEEIPALVAQSATPNRGQKWSGVAGIKFYGAFCEWLKEAVPQDETKAFKLRFTPGSGKLVLSEVTDASAASIIRDGMVYTEFKEWRMALRQREAEGEGR